MFSLTKKQVKALLDIMSSDDARPVLAGVHIAEFKGKVCAIATDSYILAAMPCELPLGEKSFVPRSSIERWHKLATAKSTLEKYELADMLEVSPSNAPNFERVVPEEEQEQKAVSFQARYMVALESLKTSPLVLSLRSSVGVGVDDTTDSTYVIMPLRIK